MAAIVGEGKEEVKSIPEEKKTTRSKKKEYAKAKKKRQRQKARAEEEVGPTVAIQTINPIMGRGLVATRDMKQGEIVLTERPFLLAPVDIRLACAQCLHPIMLGAPAHDEKETGADENKESTSSLTPPTKEEEEEEEEKIDYITCKQDCKKEYYCSIECRDEAWNLHHRAVCGRSLDRFRELIWENGVGESVSRQRGVDYDFGSHMMVARLMSMTIMHPEYSMGEEKRSHTSLYPKFHALRGVADDLSLSKATLYVTRLRTCLGVTDTTLDGKWYQWAFSRCDLNSLAPRSIFVAANAWVPADTRTPPGRYCNLLGSLINHSCRPNVEFPTHTRDSFRAITDIKKGEQLLACYTETDWDVNRRLVDLLQRFRFRCDLYCPRCQEESKFITAATRKKLLSFRA